MTTFGKNGRGPQKVKNGFFTYKGFTLIELMVVIAVVAIITSFALPSYRTLIEKRQVTSGAEQLGAFLRAEQLESVKRSDNIGAKYTRVDSANWCLGMVVVSDPTSSNPCDCTAAVSAGNACKISAHHLGMNH
jgi:prepilin-type N-terminal cleavage/methylation domain-containing protein